MDLTPSSEAQQGANDTAPASGRTTIVSLDRVKLRVFSRLLGGLRGWLDEEIHCIRVAQMDDAFFATRKGVQYCPRTVKIDDRPSAS